MKTPNITLLSILTLLVVISACKKDNNSPQTKPERLTGFVKELPHDTSTTILNYDAEGRITRVDVQPLHGALFTKFNVAYSSNQIQLSEPVQSNGFSVSNDTVTLYMDANNRVTKRIQKIYFEYTADPTYNPRTYTWDTTSYQYDAAGLVSKQIHSKHDSSWSWVVTPTMQDNRNVETTDYTNQNGNMISSSGLATVTGRGYTPSTGNVVNSSSTLETSTMYEYVHVYANKGDFTNEAVLNEVFIFDALTANKNYKNLPNRVTINQVQKDNGTIVNTQNFLYDYQFTYDEAGNIKTMERLGSSMKRTFNYTTP